MDLFVFAIYAALAACLAAFLLLLGKKWGIVERMQVRGNRFFSAMAHCDFCLSWWLSVLIAVLLALLAAEWRLLLLPFFTTPLARRLL